MLVNSIDALDIVDDSDAVGQPFKVLLDGAVAYETQSLPPGAFPFIAVKRRKVSNPGTITMASRLPIIFGLCLGCFGVSSAMADVPLYIIPIV